MVLEPDTSGDISPGLSRVIIHLSSRPGTTEPTTLGSVRAAIDDGLLSRLTDEGELELDLDQAEAIGLEVQDLIERHGEEVLANDFVRYRASEDLSTVIRALMADHERENPPNLAVVLEALQDGSIVNTLVGEGEIDADRDQFLVGEARRLIDLHGPELPAEQVL